jgi:hypothetical protein
MAETSDMKLDKSGYLLANKPNYPRVPSWPYFVWIVFLCMLFCTIMIWVIAFLFDAPLEEQAAWAKTPNPAKAPWYFIGLQELLVYFDPWIAGVVLPTNIVVGLMLIPYVDISPAKQGYYGWEGRKFAVTFFSFGVFLWFALIAVGQWFRGPSWEFYWPYFDYPIGGHTWTYPGMPLKVTEATLGNMPQMLGYVLVTLFFVVGMLAPLVLAKMSDAHRWFKMLRDYIEELGMIRYLLVQIHVLLTLAVVLKVVLRLGLEYKYVITTPWFNI